MTSLSLLLSVLILAPLTVASYAEETSLVEPTEVQDVFDTSNHIKFRGHTSGWVIVGGYAIPSEIDLQGNALRGDDGIWKIKSEAKINVGNRNASLDLQGRAVDGHLRLHGTGTLEGGQEFRIILKGGYAPTSISGEYALVFTNSYVEFADNGFRIPLFQSGKAYVDTF